MDENGHCIKSNLQFNLNTIKNPGQLFIEIEKLNIFKFTRKHKWCQIDKLIPEIWTTVGGIIISDFKLYYRTVMIKMILFWHDSHIGQWTRIKDWDISSHFPQLTDFFFYKKIVKTYELDKRTHLQLIVLGSLNLIIHEN